MKRFISMVLALALVFSLVGIADLPISVSAAEATSGTCGENVTWKLEDGVLTISGTGAIEDSSWSDLDLQESITKVVIEEGVIGICSGAFWRCSNLSGITIADSVTSLGDFAFRDCSGLTSITISRGVTDIGYNVFAGCTALAEIRVDEDNTAYSSDEHGVLFNKDKTVLLRAPNAISGTYTIPNGVEAIDTFAFSECSGLTGISIPSGVTVIGDYAFQNCSIEDVIIPNSVIDVGMGAFEKTPFLEKLFDDDGVAISNHVWLSYRGTESNVVIPDGITVIAGGAFSQSKALVSVTIPEGVVTIGYNAFGSCSNLTEVMIPKTVNSFGRGTFSYCSKLERVTIPYGVTIIPDSMFYGCSSLKSVTLPDGVTAIGDSAFSSAGITDIEIPASVETIGFGAFNCSKLSSVTLHEGLEFIDGLGFANCPNLTKIEFPTTVETVGPNSFVNCTSLNTITFTGDAPTFGGMMFGEQIDTCFGEVTATVYYPGSNTTWTDENKLNYGGTLTWEPLDIAEIIASGTCGENVTWTLDDEGVLTISGTGAMGNYSSPSDTPWYDQRVSITGVVMENGVTSVGRNAFQLLNNLTSVKLSNSIISIGDDAFTNCDSLNSVLLMEGVMSIGTSAFYGCSSLTSITIPNSVTNIGGWAFAQCANLESIVIPGNVTTIGQDVFAGCSSLSGIWVDEENAAYSSDESGVLFNKDKRVLICAPKGIDGFYSIPNGVFEIAQMAFSDCKKLTEVKLSDSVRIVGASAFANCDALSNVSALDRVISIGIHSFGNTPFIEELVDPEGFAITNHILLSYRGAEANVVIPETVSLIADGAFMDCTSVETVTIPMGVEVIPTSMFSGCTNLSSITIPDSVITISPSAFVFCRNLESITIPNGVTNIGDSAFRGCTNLETITIPDSVTIIRDSAFWECTSLTNVMLSSNITSVGESMFYSCSSLENITIPEGVTTIGDYAFWSCYRLKSITLPNDIITIGECAFDWCDELNTVFYTGSEVQKSAIAVDTYNYALLNATWHYDVTEIAYADGYVYDCSCCDGHYFPDGTVAEGVYVVTFRYDDGSVISKKAYASGDTVTIPATPALPDGLGAGYEFAGWDKEVTVCQGNAVYTAVFEQQYVGGDVDGDDQINSKDVEYLLWHTLYPIDYPMGQKADFNADGDVNSEDVEYLLWHILFPSNFPITMRSVSIS